MKILAIRLHNIASLGGPHSIDFRTAPLAHAGLFAITGPTGAGKSTLLDALCLALYGNTPRLRSAPGRDSNAPDVEGETLTTADPRTLLRRGESSGFAEVDFLGRDGREYRACWRVRRARGKASGKLQGVEQSLISLPDQQVITAQKREFDRLLPERLGLSFDQFTRAVLLAQSEFSTFLKADDNQRSELLEKLTDTDIYSRLSVAAYRRAKACEKEVQALELRLGDQMPAAPEARRVLETRSQATREQLQTLQTRLQALTREQDWLDTDRRLEAHWRQAQREHQSILSEQVARGDQHTLLNRLEVLAPQRHLFIQHRQITATLSDLEEKGRSVRQQLQIADTQRHEAHEQLVHQQKALESSREHYRQQQPLLEQCAISEQRRQDLDQRITQYRQLLDTLQGDMSGHQQTLEAQRQQQRQQQKALEAIDTRLGALTGQVSSPAQWRQHTQDAQDHLRLRRQQLDTLQHALAHWQALDQYYRGLVQRQQADQRALEALVPEGQQARTRLEQQQSQLEQLSQSIERLRVARSNSVDTLRAGLVEKTPCPVCGGYEHPYTTAPPLRPAQTMLEATEREERHQLEQAQGARDDAERRCAELRGRYSELKSRITQREEELGTLKGQHDEARQTLAACEGADALMVLTAEARMRALKDQHADIERQYTKAVIDLKQFDRDQQEREPLLAELGRQEMDTVRLETELEHARRQINELRATLAPLQKERDALAETLKAQLTDYTGVSQWRNHLDQTLQTCEQQLDAASQHHDRCQQHAQTLQQTLVQVEQQQSEQRHQHTVLSMDIDQWRKSHPDIDDNILQTLMAYDSNDHQELAQKMAELERRARDGHLLVQERLTVLQEHRRQRVSEDTPALDTSGNEPSDTAQARRDAYERNLTEQRHRFEETIELAQRERDEAEHALRDDDRCRALASELQQSLEHHRRALTRWGRISGLIGAADGKVFRRIAQAWNLERLIDHANIHLESLARRYRLARGGSELGLLVIDTEMGDERRSVHSLSGGETFLVSLALALALASMASNQLSIETLFIDEGFGSLDPQSLAQAMDALDALQSLGRRVGVISHVQDMHERIPVQVRVAPRGNGQSDITLS